MKKQQQQGATKFDKLHHLLGRLGNSEITLAEFWQTMAEHKLTDADIDEFCAKHNGGSNDRPDAAAR